MRGRFPRRGFSLLEVVVAMAILAVALVPVFDLFGSARAVLGSSRDELELQARAVEAVTRARAAVMRGEVPPLDAAGQHVDEYLTEGVAVRVVVRAMPRRGLLALKVRVEGGGRWFELGQVVAEPGGSYLQRGAAE